ncbi:MAG: hypothetical protein NC311_07665 [Muribaculaceae bacterium]|nr:hypothetical protein [Muribaculaceae bacterium]
MTQPSDKDIERAKRWLVNRLDAELSMTRDMERLFRDAAKRICEVCYKYNTTPFRLTMNSRMRDEIERIIEELKEQLTDDYLTLCAACVPKDEDDSGILMFALRQGKEDDFSKSLNEYVDNYKEELSLLIGAGIFLGLSAAATADSIGRHLRKPWNNPDLAEAVEAPLTYGRGRTNSMFTATSNLTKQGIANSWMRKWYDDHKDAEGYWVMRGSSYDCSICDAQVGWHPGEYELPPYHLSCCCIAVPYRKN